jgi:DNA-binding XRE family transcriptional regulator
MLNTKNVNEIEDNNVKKASRICFKVCDLVSKAVTAVFKMKKKVLGASSADLMLEFVH